MAGVRELLDSLTKARMTEASIVSFVVGLLMLVSRFGDYLLKVPRKVLLEKLICDDFYRRTPGDGLILEHLLERCKIVPIQEELGQITGKQMVCDFVPGELFSVLVFHS